MQVALGWNCLQQLSVVLDAYSEEFKALLTYEYFQDMLNIDHESMI
jgi:hypothetical protein